MYTVAIPAYNEEAVIADALQSIQSQIHPDAEILVCANGCNDRTAEIARSHGARVVETEKCGLVFAVNTLFRNAKHPIVIKVDADVRLGPNALQLLADMKGDIVVGAQRFCDSSKSDFLTRLYTGGSGLDWQVTFCGRAFAIDMSRFREVMAHFNMTELPTGRGDNALIRAMLDVYADHTGRDCLWRIDRKAHVIYRPPSFFEAPKIDARTRSERRRLARMFPEWRQRRAKSPTPSGSEQFSRRVLRRVVAWRSHRIGDIGWVRSEASRL